MTGGPTMRIEFIEDCRALYRRWSVQFAIFAGVVLTTAVAERDSVVAFINSLPEPYLSFAPVLTLLFSIGAPILLLAIKQPKLAAEKAARDEAKG